MVTEQGGYITLLVAASHTPSRLSPLRHASDTPRDRTITALVASLAFKHTDTLSILYSNELLLTCLVCTLHIRQGCQ